MSANTISPFDLELTSAGRQETTQVRVINLNDALPDPSTADRRSLVTATKKAWPDLPSDDDRWVVSRGCAAPKEMIPVAKAGLQTLPAGEAEIDFFPTKLLLPYLIPLWQPRIADSPSSLAPPEQIGAIDAHGNMLPVVTMTFKNMAHLTEHVTALIRGTFKQGRDLKASIVAQGVTQPIMAYLVTIIMEDTGEEYTTLAVADGITRVVMSWAVALGGTVPEGELPEVIAGKLLAHTTGTDMTAQHRKGVDKVYKEFKGTFASAAGDTSDPDLTRIGQTMSLPAHVIVGCRKIGEPLTDGQLTLAFLDAVSSAVSQRHGLARDWPASAVGANSGVQAIRRAEMSGVLSPAVVRVATGVDEFSPGPVAAGAKAAPTTDTALARAVYLASALCKPDAFDEIKRHLRAIRGEGSITRTVYAGCIGTMFTRGWSPWKPESSGSELKAWLGGGAIPHYLYGTDWCPVVEDHYRDLVPIALDELNVRQESARATLQVAGGMALMAEGMLLTSAGSTAQSHVRKGVTFHRSQPQVIVETLGKTETGLWLLAHAADSFQSRNQSVTAYGVTKTAPAGAYRMSFPKPGSPSTPVEVVSDDSGRQLLDFDMVRTVAGLRQSPSGKNGGNGGRDDSAPARMSRLQTSLSSHLMGLERDFTCAREISGSSPEIPVFSTAADWESFRNSLVGLIGIVAQLQPVETPAMEDDPDDEGFFDAPDDEGFFDAPDDEGFFDAPDEDDLLEEV